ncbi:DUF5522 domain-containing protein [Chitinophaga rhizophila]|uniref:Uncharacterized protein n=1 Tax=Chitinophaga rhizophila TaxID=2866212 RepID=A0ABS7GF93_9BACT|nr:DUF5522 domain-containing protein [Chitinophaga rhizophila]MBW8686362.1 hypothetical protein [Chitinophaga rhizophila]
MKPPLREKIDFYYNEQGYMVFTEHYHLQRGYCCGNGCKHCPYAYEKVPEPKRTSLLANRKDGNKEK